MNYKLKKRIVIGVAFYLMKGERMKIKQDRWDTRWCKKLNRQLLEDVFKDRFSIREVQKMGYIDDHSEHWYVFEK